MRRLHVFAEVKELFVENLQTVLITADIRDAKLKSNILKNLRKLAFDDTVNSIEETCRKSYHNPCL